MGEIDMTARGNAAGKEKGDKHTGPMRREREMTGRLVFHLYTVIHGARFYSERQECRKGSLLRVTSD